MTTATPHRSGREGNVNSLRRSELNPVALIIALLGVGLTVLGLFLPAYDNPGFSNVEKNTMIQHGAVVWTVVVFGVVFAVNLAWAYQHRINPSWWGLTFPISVGISAATLLTGTKLYPVINGRVDSHLPGTHAAAGTGVYVVLAGAVISGLGLVALRLWPTRSLRQCPDCAEMVLADANVCKHWFRLAAVAATALFSVVLPVGARADSVAATGQAINVTDTTATLVGSVSTTATDAAYTFEYGPSVFYSIEDPDPPRPIGAGDDQTVSQTITGLSPNTTYHFEVVVIQGASSMSGSATAHTGGDGMFTTGASSNGTEVTTGRASRITATGAVLTGGFGSLATGAFYIFQYGTSAQYGQSTPVQAMSGGGVRLVSATVTGLAPGTTYHFRLLVAVPSSTGSATSFSAGNDATFTTDAHNGMRPAAVARGEGIVTPGGRVGTLRIDRSTLSDVLAFAGQPDVLTSVPNGTGRANYTRVGYGCDSQGACRDEYDINQQTGTLSNFSTMSRSFSTSNGTRVGMSTHQAEHREHRSARAGCYSGILERRGADILYILVFGRTHTVGGSNPTLRGGHVGELYAVSTRNDVLGC